MKAGRGSISNGRTAVLLQPHSGLMVEHVALVPRGAGVAHRCLMREAPLSRSLPCEANGANVPAGELGAMVDSCPGVVLSGRALTHGGCV